MTTQTGLWIDHRKAVIVVVSDQGDTAKHIESNVERNGTNAAGRGPGGSHGLRESGAEDVRERHFAGQLREFYDDVIAQVRDSEAILIFGPGEAKLELKTRLGLSRSPAKPSIDVEAADQLTEPQMVAKVKEHFGLER